MSLPEASALREERALDRSLRIAARLLPFALAAALALYIGLAQFAQPADDDFCFSARVRDLGFVEAQKDWYRTWSGRYAATAALSAFGALGDPIAGYAWAPTLVLLATFASFLVLVASARLPAMAPPAIVATAAALTLLFVTGVPDPAQTFYWMAGAFTYQLGNVASVLLAATLILHERSPGGAVRRAARLVAAALLVVVAVGSNEVTLVLVLLALAGGTAFAWRRQRPTKAIWLALLVVGAVAALLSVTAPGNAARASGIGGDGMLRLPAWLAALAWLPWVALRVLGWLAQPALWAGALIVLAATYPACRTLFARNGRFDTRWLAVPLAWLALVLALSAIGFAINRYPLPERAESVVYLAFLLAGLPSFLVLAHYAFGARLAAAVPVLARYTPACLLVALLGSPTFVEASKDVYRGYRYAGEMRARHLALQAAALRGQTDVVVASLSRPPRTLFATDLTTDPRNHRNRCASQYYGIGSIRLGTPAR